MKLILLKKSSGVSTLVGVVVFALVFLLAASFLTLYITRLTQFSLTLNNEVRNRVKNELIVKTVSGYWNLRNGTLEVSLISNYPETVLITAIVIVYHNGGYVLISQYGVKPTEVQILKCVNSCSNTLSNASLPIPLNIGRNLTILIKGVAFKEIRSVTLTISTPYTSLILPINPRSNS